MKLNISYYTKLSFSTFKCFPGMHLTLDSLLHMHYSYYCGEKVWLYFIEGKGVIVIVKNSQMDLKQLF